MKRVGPRALAAFPFVFVAIALAALAVAGDARPKVLSIEIELGKVAALLGLATAALTFGRGDYLRRGWGMSAACYLFLLARDGWIFASPATGSTFIEGARAGLVLAANACLVYGTWTLARAWRVAGLEYAESRVVGRVVIALAVFAALLFAGPAAVVDAQGALIDSHLWFAVASDVGDLLALPLLAPVAMTAIAVRGGTLRWPWALLTGSLFAWLVYDAVLSIPDLFHVDGSAFRHVGEAFRMLAATAGCAAGLAQRRAVIDDDSPLEADAR